ncbi:MAG: hypothetical protein AB1656_19520 [Candidatus Omnitrophota bacterium]
MNETKEPIQERELIAAICPACKRVLCHVPAGSSIFCHDCRLWFDVEPVEPAAASIGSKAVA